MRNKYFKTQQRKFAAGQINRRQFINSIVAAGVAIPTALSMTDAVMAATPKSGGLLRQAFSSGSTNNSLDPMTNEGSNAMINVNWTWGNNLTEVQNDGSLAGELAESMESDDAKTWVFKLRQGVEFHNGKTLTADDVIASINRHRGDDTASAIKSLMAQIKDIRKDGENTVVMELEAPNADFAWVLSDYHAVILPTDKDGEIVVGKGIGTGGYTLEKFEPGVNIQFKRNPNYWKEGRGHFDEIESLILLDPTARQAALLNDDVDALDSVDFKTVDLLALAPHLNILETTSTQHMNILMRLDTPPYDNLDLRLALKYAVKRQELVDKVLHGHGTIGNDHDISPSQEFYNTELPQREFDADKAKYHLKKSGMEGAKLELVASNAAMDGAIDSAQLIQASATSVGIDVTVKNSPNDGFWANVWNKPGVGFVTSMWAGRPTNDWMFSACCVAGSSWNDTAWKGTPSADRFNELIVAARGELDYEKRKAMYWECQKLHNEDGGAITWGFTNLVHGVNKRIAHPEKIASNWAMDGGKSSERWWMA